MSTTTQKRRGCSGRTIIILIVILVILAALAYVLIGPAITGVVNSLSGATTANNDFMNAVVAKDFAKAYSMIDPAQQAAFGGSADGVQQLFASAGGPPSSYTFSSVATTTTLDAAVVVDSGNFGGTTKYISLILQKHGTTWNIAGLTITNSPPTAIPTA